MAESITSQEVKALLVTDTSPILLDVRRKTTYEAAPDRITGSSWCDPSEVSTWSAALPQDVPIIVYCVYGHEVSRGVATQLDKLGYEVRYLEGGIESWREAGGEVEPRI